MGDFPNRQVGPIASTWAKKPTKKRLSSHFADVFGFECFFLWFGECCLNINWLFRSEIELILNGESENSAVQGIDISHPEMAKKVPNDYDRIRDGAEVEVINSAFLGDRQ